MTTFSYFHYHVIQRHSRHSHPTITGFLTEISAQISVKISVFVQKYEILAEQRFRMMRRFRIRHEISAKSLLNYQHQTSDPFKSFEQPGLHW